MQTNECTGDIIDAALKVHRKLGPGLLESAYQACLAHELRRRGRIVHVQMALPVIFDGVRLELGYRLDMLVDECVVVELKTVPKIRRVHQAQLLSYLRLSGYQVGLLINFNVPLLKSGIKRMVNRL